MRNFFAIRGFWNLAAVALCAFALTGCERSTPAPAPFPPVPTRPPVDLARSDSRSVGQVAKELLDDWASKPDAIPTREIMATQVSNVHGREARFSLDGTRIVARLRNGEIVIIDAQSGKKIWSKSFIVESAGPTVIGPNEDGPLPMCVSRDGKYLAVVTSPNKVEIWDCARNERVAEREERAPIKFVGLDHTGTSFFISEREPPANDEGENTSAPVKIAFEDGTATLITDEGMTPGVHAMAPIRGGKGYFAFNYRNQLVYWNSELTGRRAKVLSTYDVSVSDRVFRLRSSKPCLWIHADRETILANVGEVVVSLPTASIGMNPEPVELADSEDDRSLLEFGQIASTFNQPGNPLKGFCGQIDSARRICLAEFMGYRFDMPSFGVELTPTTNALGGEFLDFSQDGRRAIFINRWTGQSRLMVHELGEIPEHPAIRCHQVMRKLLAERDQELIDAVIAEAGRRREKPVWHEFGLDAVSPQSQWEQVVRGMLDNRWVRPWTPDAIAKANAKPTDQTSIDPVKIAAEAIGLGKRGAPYEKNPAAQRLVEFILNDPKAEEREIAAFVTMSPDCPTGREVLKQVAHRAASICQPDSPLLMELADGLNQYSFEEPDVPELEATLGLIEAVADAETKRNGVVAGDTAYAQVGMNVITRTVGNVLTGRDRHKIQEGDDQYARQRVDRQNIFRRYLDYERFSKGMQLYLTNHPRNFRSGRKAREALLIAFEFDDRALGRVAAQAVEGDPRLGDLPPSARGTLAAILEWAKTD